MKTAIPWTRFHAGLAAVLFLFCGCTDNYDRAVTQAKNGANKMAIASYNAYLQKHPSGNSKTASAYYELGVLHCRENEKDEALLSFKNAIGAGYPAEKVKYALRELAGDIISTNHADTRAVLSEVRGVNADFSEYADAQIARLDALETTALSLVSDARKDLDRMQFDMARENLAKARTLVPGVALPGVADIQAEIAAKEPAYIYGQALKDAAHVFDAAREAGVGGKFNAAAYREYEKLQKADAAKLKELNDAVRYKALGSSDQERKENETVPGRRYKDFLNMKFALKFIAALPDYDAGRRGFNISGQYKAGHCDYIDLKFPVMEMDADRAKMLLDAKTPIRAEIVFNVIPRNISEVLGREELVAGCKVVAARASLDNKTVYSLDK